MPDDLQFHILFQKYYRRVFLFFRRGGFPVEDAKDLTQVVFLRVHQGMDAYRGEAEWMYVKTIARRVGLNEIRYRQSKRRCAPTVSLDGPDFPHHDSEEAGPASSSLNAEDELLAAEQSRQRAERSRLLRSAIKDLPPRMRRCMQMRIAGGLKYREIADALDVTIDTVKRLVFEGKRKLGRKLGD